MKRGALRIIFINFLCLSVPFFPIPSVKYEPIVKEKTVEIQSAAEEVQSNTAEESQDDNTSSQVQSQVQTSEQAQQTDAEAIKGQIINQHNSPYAAADSYSGVYLKNNTSLKINIKNYLEAKLSFKIMKNNEPQVLILHTHATETFKTDNEAYFTEDFSSRSLNNGQNMVSIGKIVAEKLNTAGIKTLHDTTLHDYPSYSKSYSRSAETVNSYIKKYPSIKVVLDLHRDAVSKDNGDKVKLTTEIGGKTAAQVMLVMGSQSGGVTNFPNWEENFKLAVKLQQVIEKNYPTLARPLMLMSKNYNQSLTTGSLLIEFGTDVNTLEEVHYSAQMVGDCLVELLSSLN